MCHSDRPPPVGGTRDPNDSRGPRRSRIVCRAATRGGPPPSVGAGRARGRSLPFGPRTTQTAWTTRTGDSVGPMRRRWRRALARLRASGSRGRRGDARQSSASASAGGVWSFAAVRPWMTNHWLGREAPPMRCGSSEAERGAPGGPRSRIRPAGPNTRAERWSRLPRAAGGRGPAARPRLRVPRPTRNP